jgi:hypothetical protein
MDNAPSTVGGRVSPETIAALLGGAGAAGAALAAAGVSLGLAIGGLFAAAILVPPLAASRRAVGGAGAIVLASTAGIGAVWLGFIGHSHATAWQWAMLMGLLAAFSSTLAAIAIGLEALALPPVLSGGATTALAVAWLTWPIWLPPETLGAGLQRTVDVNPVLVANGVLKFTVPWTEQSIAYGLTTLDQDVPIRLPGSPIPMIAISLAIAVFIGVSIYLKRRYMANRRGEAA